MERGANLELRDLFGHTAQHYALARAARDAAYARAALARLEEVARLSGGKVPSAAELDAGRAAYDRAQADEASAGAIVQDARAALALGANAVLVGRLQVYALAVAGALGVAHMLQLLTEELHACMAQAGCAQLSDITPDCLTPSC